MIIVFWCATLSLYGSSFDTNRYNYIGIYKCDHKRHLIIDFIELKNKTKVPASVLQRYADAILLSDCFRKKPNTYWNMLLIMNLDDNNLLEKAAAIVILKGEVNIDGQQLNINALVGNDPNLQHKVARLLVNIPTMKYK